MKKLVRKLALSCAALAVCAATLVSSTFAWYTSNTEVSASGATATASATGDSSIFISADDGENKNWSQDITVNFTAADLLPVAWDATNKKWVDIDGATDTTSGKLTFTLYFRTAKTDEEVKLYFRNIVTANTTPDADNETDGVQLPTTDNLINGAASTASGVATNKAVYSTDITKALAIMVNDVAYDISACNESPIADVNVSGGNAHEYYNEVMDTEIAVADTSTQTIVRSGGTAIELAELDNTGASFTTITFTVYLNGWDTYCFDSCKGQSFSIDLAFTSDSTTTFGTQA